MWKNEFLQTIASRFENSKTKNPRYSLRRFSSQLGISAGSLSELLSGKRPLTQSKAEQILPRLKLDRRRHRQLLALMNQDGAASREEMKKHQYWILTDFHAHLVFGNCSDDSPVTISALAKKTGLSVDQVDSIVRSLLGTGFLKKQGRGFVNNSAALKSSDGIPSSVIRRHHFMSLEIAKKSLNHDSLEQRDFTSFSFALEKGKLNEVRREIRSFYERLENLYGGGEESELHRISIQVFPFKAHPPTRNS